MMPKSMSTIKLRYTTIRKQTNIQTMLMGIPINLQIYIVTGLNRIK